MVRRQAVLLALVASMACFPGADCSQAAPPDPDVALAPFAVVDDDGADTLRGVADACLERLASSLASKGIEVVRRPSLDDKTLSRARPARWAVLGRFSRDKDRIQAELRLMEVSSGDEMRAYFNASADPKAIIGMGDAVAERIALFVKEKRG